MQTTCLRSPQQKQSAPTHVSSRPLSMAFFSAIKLVNFESIDLKPLISQCGRTKIELLSLIFRLLSCLIYSKPQQWSPKIRNQKSHHLKPRSASLSNWNIETLQKFEFGYYPMGNSFTVWVSWPSKQHTLTRRPSNIYRMNYSEAVWWRTMPPKMV